MNTPTTLFHSTGDNITDTQSDGCTLDVKHPVDGHTGYHFVVREDLHDSRYTHQRVCLYQENVVNPIVRGNSLPYDLLLNNELRNGRSLLEIQDHMTTKVSVRIGTANMRNQLR